MSDVYCLDHIDFMEMQLSLLFDCNMELPHFNRSQRTTDYRHYHNPFTKRFVEECYAEDIERFEYGF